MTSERREEATLHLSELRSGDGTAVERLLPLVYDELRALARRLLRRERPDHSFQPTDLVHEAYLRLIDQRKRDWKDRAHFIAIATTVMRRILVDHARRRGAEKRGGGQERVSLDAAVVSDGRGDVSILEMDTALGRLADLDPRRAEIAGLRIFGGLGAEEIAEVLDLSRRTAERHWRTARAWLIVELWGD